MTIIDYLLLAMIALSAVMGLFRGFIAEAFSLLGWIVGAWAAWRFGFQVAEWLPDFFGYRTAQVWVARGAILVGVLILTGVANAIVSFVMGRTGLDGTDRVVGLIFGLGRGIVLTGITVSVLEFAGFQESSWWRESTLIPYAEPIVDSLRDIADKGLELLQDGASRMDASSFAIEE
jgi:membrane protein required for colicin V production